MVTDESMYSPDLLDVKAGEETPVRLHDRNTWLTAMREVRSGRDPEKRAPRPP